MFKKLRFVFVISSIILVSSCEVFEEQNVSYDTSMISIVASFDSGNSCYIDPYDEDFDDAVDLKEEYILKILTEDTMVVCCKQINSADPSFINGKTIKIYSSSEFIEPGTIPLTTPIPSTEDNINFNALGSGTGTCSEIDGTYSKVTILYMRNHRNKKYIMVTDTCGSVAGIAINPYMQ